jgi:hypothetical protein
MTGEVNGSKGKVHLLPCPDCSKETSHLVLASYDVVLAWENNIYTSHQHQVIQCQGCLGVTFREGSQCSEDIESYDDNGKPTYVEFQKLYPSRVAGRSALAGACYLPDKVRRIYGETCRALAGEQPVLTGVGIRAVLEAVCQERRARGKNLEARIDELVRRGVLTSKGAETLHSTRLLGNLAAHAVQAHSIEELSAAMDVAEHLLTSVYVLPKKARNLPKRKKGARRGASRIPATEPK